MVYVRERKYKCMHDKVLMTGTNNSTPLTPIIGSVSDAFEFAVGGLSFANGVWNQAVHLIARCPLPLSLAQRRVSCG